MKIVRAHIKDGIVINMSVGDSEKPWTPPVGITIVELQPDSVVGVGFIWDGKAFIRPEDVVTPKQPTLEERLTVLESKVSAMELTANK